MKSYLQMSLKAGGVVKTNTKAPGNVDANWIKIVRFSHEVHVPTDTDGLVTGERSHGAFLMEVNLEKSAPYLLTAICAGIDADKKDNQLDKVVIRQYQGADDNHVSTIALLGAKVVRVKPLMLNYKIPAFEKHPHLLELDLRYDAMATHYVDGAHQSGDCWIGGPESAAMLTDVVALAEAGAV